MSRSPRKNLRRSLEALNDALDACELHADARADLVAAVGAEGYEELRRIQTALSALTDLAERPRS